MCCEVTVTVTHRHRPDWYIGSKSRWRHSRSQNSVSITTTPLCLPDELPGEILLRIENPSDLFYLGITFHTFRVSITPLHIPFRRLVICDVLDSVGKDLADKLNLSWISQSFTMFGNSFERRLTPGSLVSGFLCRTRGCVRHISFPAADGTRSFTTDRPRSFPIFEFGGHPWCTILHTVS